jgi:hypothetical protein
VAAGLQLEANFLRQFAIVLDNENATATSRLRLFLAQHKVYRRRMMNAHRFRAGFRDLSRS